MDMNMSPLRPQNYLFGCELKADKDYHFKVANDENKHPLSLRTVSLGAGAKDELHIVEAEAMNYEGSPIKVTLATLKIILPPEVVARFHREKVKCAADEDDDEDEDDHDDDEDDDKDDFDYEEAEEKSPNGKDSKPSTPRSKGQESFKKQEKTPKTLKGPSSVEDTKAKMQASIEKGGSLPKVEAKFINYVKNCF
ncbi:npm1 protein [Lynx pardinus]|uniref:Nucleophosmin n=1 Tax=Lynx pardinus TaxID=191816 RepID=A0A485NZE7_LYNPA|nr:npm1 protein [Lynx pardinus]